MASPSPRRLVREQTFECDPETTTEDLSCIICKKLRSKIYQAACKCIYCDACIKKFLSDGREKYCFGGKTECTEELLVLKKNVRRNAAVIKDIMKTKVRCPNTSCSVTGNLNEIRKHFNDCVKQTMPCPYYSIGCHTFITCKDSILNHLNTDALEHAELVTEWINMDRMDFQKIQEVVSTLKEELKKQNEEQSTKMQSLEEKLNDKEDKIEKISEEVDVLQVRSKNTIENLTKLTDTSTQVTDKISKLEEDVKQQRITDSKNVMLSEQLRILDEQIKSMKEESEKTTKVVDALRRQLEGNQRQIGINAQTSNELTHLPIEREMESRPTTVVSLVGEMTLKIDNFSNRKYENKDICSPYFYSHRNGYKLQMSVNPGRNNSQHLSVFIAICKGEYDTLLPWPCKDSFRIFIVNQRSGEHAPIATFNYASSTEEVKPSFNKPITEANTACGCNLATLKHLQSTNGVIVDNTVVVKCVIIVTK